MGCVQMVEVEIDMIVSDSLKALELYEKVFNIERIEVTNFPKDENEVVFFSIRGSISCVG
jgi:PhnB protein